MCDCVHTVYIQRQSKELESVDMSPLGLLSVVLLLTNGALAEQSLPVQTCSTNDQKQLDECVRNYFQNVLAKIIHGDPKLGLPDLDPLDIKEIVIRQGSDQVGLKLNMYDCKMYGNTNVKYKNVRVDLKKRHMEWDVDNENGYQIIGNYKASGKVLLLPITGNGKINITLIGMTTRFNVDYDITKKKGKDYIVITNLVLTNSVRKTVFKLDNLFNGDKLLGDNMNQFLNENSKELSKEFGPMIISAMSELYKKIITLIFSKAPYDTIFSEKNLN